MCERCLFDLMMYGEPVRHEVSVWEKGRFEAKPTANNTEEEDTDAAGPIGRSKTPDRGDRE
jgi:hypothetical protein